MAPANHRLMQQIPLQHHLPSPDTSFSADSVTSTAPPSPPRSTSSCSTTVLPASLLPASQPRLQPRRGRSRSGTNLPESVVTAFQYIQEAHHGRYVGPSWVSFPHVSSDGLEALVSAATREGIYKFRYDFDPLSELLTLRMPEGKPHNFTKNGIGCSIRDHLHRRLDQAIQDEEYEADTLRSIKQRVSLNIEAEIKLPTGATKVPDVSFFHQGQTYPPLVVEIGSSQKSAELPRLARDSIAQTEGKIQTVITVHIGYDNPPQRSEKRRRQRSSSNQGYTGRVTRSRSRSRQSQTSQTSRSQSRGRGSQASMVRDEPTTWPLAPSSTVTPPSAAAGVSLFRLRDQVLDHDLFRDSEGVRVDGSLELNVADFVPRDDDAFKSLSFNIPFKDLYDALERGEKQQRLEEQTPPPEQTSRKRVHFEFNWELSQPEPESMSPSTRELRSSSSKRRKTEVTYQDDKVNHSAVAIRRRRSQ